jgi:hypothetical protein
MRKKEVFYNISTSPWSKAKLCDFGQISNSKFSSLLILAASSEAEITALNAMQKINKFIFKAKDSH